MLTFALDQASTYRRTLAIYGGDFPTAFALAVQKILRRHFTQNDLPPPPDLALQAFARSLWELARRHGLPAALAAGQQGDPHDMPDSEVNRLADPLVAAFPQPEARAHLGLATRDLIRALFQPEFKKCRQSFKDVAPGAPTCERQTLDCTRPRISGTHCVDCPYWTQLTPEKNEKLLRKEWAPDATPTLEAHLGLFLPEDFRALRHLLHLHLRFGRR